eukprot:10247522-Karenia_brevis.AAC.1
MVQYQPDLDVLGSPHTNMPAWVERVKSRPTNPSWCAHVGKIHRRQHSYQLDIIRRRAHAISITKEIVSNGDAALDAVSPPREEQRIVFPCGICP